jgi:hypothetical protein
VAYIEGEIIEEGFVVRPLVITESVETPTGIQGRDYIDMFEKDGEMYMQPSRWIFGDDPTDIILAPTYEQLKRFIYKSKGNLMLVCEMMGWSEQCRSELYRWIMRFDLRMDVKGARDQLVDKAEHVVANALDAGDVNVAQFVLKTQGKYRGWREKEEEKPGDVYKDLVVIEDNEKVDLSKLDSAGLSEYISNKIRDGRSG